jgi:hypothetical protein
METIVLILAILCVWVYIHNTIGSITNGGEANGQYITRVLSFFIGSILWGLYLTIF